MTLKARVYKRGPHDWVAEVGVTRVWCDNWEIAMQQAWGLIMYPEVCS